MTMLPSITAISNFQVNNTYNMNEKRIEGESISFRPTDFASIVSVETWSVQYG